MQAICAPLPTWPLAVEEVRLLEWLALKRVGQMEAGSSGSGRPEGAATRGKVQPAHRPEGRRQGVGGCLPKAPIIPSVQISSEKVRGTIELWKEKALIGKFVGV